MSKVQPYYYVYLVSIGGGFAYYCGIARDVEARFAEHCTGKGAKCFSAWIGYSKVIAWVSPFALPKSIAMAVERLIKSLPHEFKGTAEGQDHNALNDKCDCVPCLAYRLYAEHYHRLERRPR